MSCEKCLESDKIKNSNLCFLCHFEANKKLCIQCKINYFYDKELCVKCLLKNSPKIKCGVNFKSILSNRTICYFEKESKKCPQCKEFQMVFIEEVCTKISLKIIFIKLKI